MKNAAIYCRVSTEDQEREGTSLISQREACIAKAKELDYEVPGDMVFSEAWTGTDTDRPKLNELRQMIRDGNIEALVCYSTDRLARNPIHIAIIAEECQKQDTALVFVTEPLDNSPEGQLIRYVKGFAAQIEHEKIRERTMRGKRQGVKLGKLSTGGSPPFGYDAAEGKRVIKDSQAGIVRTIFSRLAYDGYTLYRMASELNLAGITGPRGGKWDSHTIHRIVNNPAYMGITYAFRYRVVEPARPRVKRSYSKTTHQLRDKEEWIEVPGVTPTIVSKEVYNLAQKQLELNRHKSPRNKIHDYLLSGGRLRCGVCGHAMVGSAKSQGNGNHVLRYRCVSNMKPYYYDHCDQGSIMANSIESIVWQEISRVLTKPDVVLAELKQQKANKPVTLEADRILTENNITNARGEEQRYLRQYGRGVIDNAELDTEIKRIRKYREQQEVKLADIEEQVREYEEASVNYDNFSQAVKIIADRLKDADHDLKQLALEALNITVTLQPDRTVAINGTIPAQVRSMMQSYDIVTQRTPLLHFTLKK